MHWVESVDIGSGLIRLPPSLLPGTGPCAGHPAADSDHGLGTNQAAASTASSSAQPPPGLQPLLAEGGLSAHAPMQQLLPALEAWRSLVTGLDSGFGTVQSFSLASPSSCWLSLAFRGLDRLMWLCPWNGRPWPCTFSTSPVLRNQWQHRQKSRLQILRTRATCHLSNGDQRPPLYFQQYLLRSRQQHRQKSRLLIQRMRATYYLLPAVCYVVKIHLPKLQESLHRLAGMDAISHILQMWEAKHYRKLHDLWHTQYESISVGNFALAFTTTLLAPTLASEFNTDDSYGLFTEAWLVALKRSGTSWHREMAAAFERAATAAHAMLVPLGQVSQLRELVDWRHGKQRNLAMLEAFARLSPQPESAAAHLERRCHSPDLAANPLVHQLVTASDPSPTRTAMQDESLPNGAVLNSPQAGAATTAYSDDRARGQPLEWNVDRLALVRISLEVTSSSSRNEQANHSRLMVVPPTPPLSRRTQSSSSVAPHATTKAETNSSASSEKLARVSAKHCCRTRP